MVDNNDFENEVLVRLSVIEEKLESLESAKSKTYDNNQQLALIEKRVSDIEQKSKALTAAITSIITAIVVAGITWLLKI